MHGADSSARNVGRLLSIQVGLPETYGQPHLNDSRQRPWRTGFYKRPVWGPVIVGRTNIDGDGQADLRVHGGVDKAVLAYSADHYAAWRAELGKADMSFGAFGENLTIAGVTENDVCIGDVWQVGSAVLEVSQPRQPCWKLARRWQMKELPKLVVKTGRGGWYLRVMQEGIIQADVNVNLVERRHRAWSVARANQAMYGALDRVELVELAALPELAKSWVSDLS